jgi:hypothetical protein
MAASSKNSKVSKRSKRREMTEANSVSAYTPHPMVFLSKGEDGKRVYAEGKGLFPVRRGLLTFAKGHLDETSKKISWPIEEEKAAVRAIKEAEEYYAAFGITHMDTYKEAKIKYDAALKLKKALKAQEEADGSSVKSTSTKKKVSKRAPSKKSKVNKKAKNSNTSQSATNVSSNINELAKVSRSLRKVKIENKQQPKQFSNSDLDSFSKETLLAMYRRLESQIKLQ